MWLHEDCADDCIVDDEWKEHLCHFCLNVLALSLSTDHFFCINIVRCCNRPVKLLILCNLKPKYLHIGGERETFVMH